MFRGALTLGVAITLTLASAATAVGPVAAGVLSVNADPGPAAVYVDGRFVGQTPISIPGLSAGDHRVRLVKDGYLENSRLVSVDATRPKTLTVRLTARAQNAARTDGLRIVIIAGEDAVNVIRQATAVGPIVEVRDRNNLPVAGATVTFTLGGGNAATFAGGVQTVTVTTSAVGRAAATALNPVTAGRFQIVVQATFDGQTAAATISQVNVATAAAGGAAAGAATAAGAAAAGGGATAGLSGVAIGGIVAGAAGGTVLAVKAATGSGGSAATTTTTFTGPFNMQLVELRTFTSGGTVTGTCTVTTVTNYALTLTLDQHADGTVSGTLKNAGPQTDIATTCAGYALKSQNNSDSSPVTGTTGSFGTTVSDTATDSDPNAGTYTFTETTILAASLSNGVVTLTVTFDRRATGISGLPPGVGFRGAASGTVVTTLR